MTQTSEPEIGLPSRAARRNMALAYQAIHHVRQTLTRTDSPDGWTTSEHRRAHPDRRAHHVRSQDFPAWLLGRFEQAWVIGHESESTAHRHEDWLTTTLAHRIARTIDETDVHGPGVHAMVAFAYLLGLGIRPIDYMHRPGVEEAYVLIGRTLPFGDSVEPTSLPVVEDKPENSDSDSPLQDVLTDLTSRASKLEIRPETWGPDAVVCDAYNGLVFRQRELLNTEYYFEYYPAESQVHVPAAQLQQFDG